MAMLSVGEVDEGSKLHDERWADNYREIASAAFGELDVRIWDSVRLSCVSWWFFCCIFVAIVDDDLILYGDNKDNVYERMLC